MNHCPNAAMVLVGLKADLLVNGVKEPSSEMVKIEEGEKVASQINAMFHMQVSSLTGYNVKDLFIQAMKDTLNHQQKKMKKK
jgi:GTPase SAR1 family protein